MTDPPRLRGFACNHGDNKGWAATLRAEVCEALKCEPERLITAIVYNLNWEHNVAITGIPCDMWSAVKSEFTRYVTDEEYDALPDDAPSTDEWVTVATAYIECDSIEDGFALTWQTWKKWFEDRAKED